MVHGVAEALRQHVGLLAVVGQHRGVVQIAFCQYLLLLQEEVVGLLHAVLNEVLARALLFVVESEVVLLLKLQVYVGHIVAQRILERLVEACHSRGVGMEITLACIVLCLLHEIAVDHLTAYIFPVAVAASHGIVAVAYAKVAQELGMRLHVLGARPLEGRRSPLLLPQGGGKQSVVVATADDRHTHY